MPTSSTPAIFQSDGLITARLPTTPSTLAVGTPTSLTSLDVSVQDTNSTAPTRSDPEPKTSKHSTTVSGSSMTGLDNASTTVNTNATAAPVGIAPFSTSSSISSAVMSHTVPSTAGSSTAPFETGNVTSQPQSTSVTPGKSKNATIGIVGSVMGLLLIVLALLYLKRYVYRQRQSEDFNSKFHFRRTAEGGIVRKVDDRRFIAEFPGSRTTVVETFADDGTHIDDVRVGGKHSSGVVSWASVDEESKVSLVDFGGLSYRMSPSPSSNGVDTISSRQTPTNEPLIRTPDTIPHTNQEGT